VLHLTIKNTEHFVNHTWHTIIYRRQLCPVSFCVGPGELLVHYNLAIKLVLLCKSLDRELGIKGDTPLLPRVPLTIEPVQTIGIPPEPFHPAAHPVLHKPAASVVTPSPPLLPRNSRALKTNGPCSPLSPGPSTTSSPRAPGAFKELDGESVAHCLPGEETTLQP
jgi:hypothetical protein